MCEYVDRTDSFRLKGIDKRKNPVSSNVWPRKWTRKRRWGMKLSPASSGS